MDFSAFDLPPFSCCVQVTVSGHLLCLEPPPAILTCPTMDTACSRQAGSFPGLLWLSTNAEAELRKGNSLHGGLGGRSHLPGKHFQKVQRV